MSKDQDSKTFLKKKYKLAMVGSSYKITLPMDFVKGFDFKEGDELTVAIDVANRCFIISKEE
ncbi:MAG: AbrB/MazE/SpoVT family DNA-binding domain-containing protein [Candidatus Heimdallarchaeota archaeon]